MTMEEKRAKVQKFLEDLDRDEKASLVFYNMDEEQVKCYPENREIDYLVLMVINCSHSFCSMNFKTGERETSGGRRRSSLDIWRHVKYFNKTITIFDVMDSIWRQRNSLSGQYCGEVERRVFRLLKNVKQYHLGRTDLFDKKLIDEYGLVFVQWKGINK